MSEFDRAASEYDQTFTNTLVGKEQRRQVFEALAKDQLDQEQKILEINCGTGVDAKYLAAQGNDVLATDFSQAMIDTAKINFPNGNFMQLDMMRIHELPENYSLIFSNFGGLNCLSPDDLKQFITNAYEKLEKDGHLALVIMGKRCFWDNAYLFLKGKWSSIGRRNTLKPIEVSLGQDSVKTWYFSPKEVKGFAQEHYHIKRLKPIGLYVPPSYMAPFFENRRWLFSLFKLKDRFVRFSFLSNFSDHYYICLQKK